MATASQRPREGAQQRARQRPRGGPRARVALSREQIVDAAIATLDREGARGLTLRGLAGELGGGLGSIYWHVSGKDELLELACDELVGRALAAVDDEEFADGDGIPSPPMEVSLPDASPDVLDAAERLRRLSLSVFAQMQRHPWLAPIAQQNDGGQNGMWMWEQVGRALDSMGLTRRQQFNGSTAVIGYVVGVSAEVAGQDRLVDPDLTKEEQMDAMMARWQGPEFDASPWIRSITDEFRTHDDTEQFAAGLDLLILGLVTQAVA